jgi:uncharacterized repeat protein (TIGR03803 family)
MRHADKIRFLAVLALVLVVASKMEGAPVFKILHSFNGPDGSNPIDGLVLGSDGNFYGMTQGGGTSDAGAVYRISPIGIFTNLHSFNGSDGSGPKGSLVEGYDGNFYGTTYMGGTSNLGTIFRISTNGDFSALHSFTGSDSAFPTALVRGSDSNFYGICYGDPNTLTYPGSVFQITPGGVLTNIYWFQCGNFGEACAPLSLVQGGNNDLYGTTMWMEQGMIFRVNPSGTFTYLHVFNTDGPGPSVFPSGLIQGGDGNFYGTTQSGGPNGEPNSWGTVFQVSPSGNYVNLHSFTFSRSGGFFPSPGLVQGNDGSLYGTTGSGGRLGKGTLFRVSTNGSIIVLCSFGGSNGNVPVPALMQGGDGNFYGVTSSGGKSTNCSAGCGTVFGVSGIGCPILRGTWSNLVQTCNTESAGQRCNLKGAVTVQNIGPGNAPTSFVRYYLSQDTVLDSNDVVLKQVRTSAIKASESKQNRLAVNLPTGNSASGQFIIAVIGANKSPGGCNEINNSVVFGPLP